MPERLTPGLPLRFASALPLAGYGRGVIVTSVEGRPIKIDGNPRHPASLGATDVFAEAAVLSLYDPDRSQAPRSGGRIQSWSAFEAALRARIDQEASRHGSGLALLTGRVTSPTLTKQIGDLMQRPPEAKWYRYEPVEDDAIRAGAMQSFGQPLTAIPRFDDARVALLLDADPLGFGPEQIRLARDIIAARQPHMPEQSLRLYAVEPSWTLSGALADHRLALPHHLVRNVCAWRLPARWAQQAHRPHCRPIWLNSPDRPRPIFWRNAAPQWSWPGRDSRPKCMRCATGSMNNSTRRSITSLRSIRSRWVTRNRCAIWPTTFTPAVSKR